MRGTFNLAGTQAQIELEGESWTRDQKITGSVELTSGHQFSQNFGASFCAIDLRKFKKKDPKAFEVLKTIAFTSGCDHYPIELTASESGGSHCLSDGTYTLALLIGDREKPFECSQLQLPVRQRAIVDELLKLFETFKRCTIKSIKNKKKEIEVKITTPSSGDMAQIDTLALLIGFDPKTPETIKMTYQFQIKKLTVGGAGVETKKEKSKFVQTLEKNDYLSFGALDQDKAMAKIDEALLSWK